MNDIKKSLQEYLARVAAKNWPAVELRARTGAASDLVDQYVVAESGIADVIYQDMVTNAQGVGDHVSLFFVRAVGDGDTRGPSRSFSIVNEQSSSTDAGHVDGGDKATIRLLLDHAHRSHLAMVQVMSQMSTVIGTNSRIQEQMVETHSEAIVSLRDSRGDQARAEVAMMIEATKAERTGKLMDAGVAMLPALFEHLAKDSEESK